jgi:hypothetical protein
MNIWRKDMTQIKVRGGYSSGKSFNKKQLISKLQYTNELLAALEFAMEDYKELSINDKELKFRIKDLQKATHNAKNDTLQKLKNLV